MSNSPQCTRTFRREDRRGSGGPLISWLRHAPIRRTGPLRIATDQFIKLAPGWSKFAVSALPGIPAFIVGRSQPPHGALTEGQAAHLLLFGIVGKRVGAWCGPFP